MVLHVCGCHDVHLATAITTMSTNILGPIQSAIGPLLRNEKGQHVVPTHVDTSVMGPLGQAPLCCPGPPPWSLNAHYATYEKCPNADSPWQNGQSPHRQSTSTPRIGSGTSPALCAGSTLPTGSIWEVPPPAPQGRVGTSPHPRAWPPYLWAGDTFYISLYRHPQILQQPSESGRAD